MSHRGRAVRRALKWGFGACAVSWAALLPAAVWAAGHSVWPPGLLATCVYAIGAMVCHQLPERSFLLAGTPLPVCARCTGIYAGAALGTGLALVMRPRTPSPFESDRTVRRWRMALVAGVAPSAVTLLLEWTTGRVPGNAIRALAGLPIGIVVAGFVMATVADDRSRQGDQVH